MATASDSTSNARATEVLTAHGIATAFPAGGRDATSNGSPGNGSS
jgi:hypothetical protein